MKKDIRLLALIIRNFKGLKEAVITLDGESIEVFGPNGKGKTSIFDGFMWGLFGKNSIGETVFQIKPVDANNQEIHNLETEVEVVLSINGERKSFKRILFEKWSKQNGSKEKSFTNSQKYYVDDVPVSTKKAYEAAVSEVLDEDTFKLLTSTTYFNEQIGWQERRKELFKLAGELTDEEVIVSDKELAPLQDKLNGKKPHERKLQVEEQRRTLKSRITEIGPRIDEAARNIPEFEGDTLADKAKVAEIEAKVTDLQGQKVAIQSGAAIANKQAEIKSLESDIKVYRSEFERNTGSEAIKLQVTLQEKEANVTIAASKVKQLTAEIENKYSLGKQIAKNRDDLIAARQQLLNQHAVLKQAVYVEQDIDCTCPTCKQDLPVEQIEATKQSLKEQFNVDNSKKMADIAAQGAPMKDQIIAYDNQLSTLGHDVNVLQSQLEVAQSELNAHQVELDKVKLQLETVKTSVPTIENDSQYQTMITSLSALKEQLSVMQDHQSEALSGIDSEIMQLQNTKSDIEERLAKFANIAATEKRIAELQEQQEQLNEQYEDLEYVLYLINQFERKKASMVTERVNGLFKFVTFKLFHEQMEGGIKEVCETLYDGVSYQNGLNTASKTNAGIDVINALQKHYGVTAPIFLDNRESVTNLIHTDAQTISLIVSGEDKDLRIEKVAKVQDAPEQTSLFDEVV